MTQNPTTEAIASILVSATIGLFYALLYSIVLTIFGLWGAPILIDGLQVMLVGVVGGLGFLHGWRSRDRTPM